MATFGVMPSAACGLKPIAERKEFVALYERLAHLQHSFQCRERPAGRFVVDLNHVDRRTRGEIFQAPTEMRQVDSVHRGAHADDGREKVNLLLGVFFL